MILHRGIEVECGTGPALSTSRCASAPHRLKIIMQMVAGRGSPPNALLSYPTMRILYKSLQFNPKACSSMLQHTLRAVQRTMHSHRLEPLLNLALLYHRLGRVSRSTEHRTKRILASCEACEQYFGSSSPASTRLTRITSPANPSSNIPHFEHYGR